MSRQHVNGAESSEDDNSKNVLGIQLIQALKKKKQQEASSLIDQGANVRLPDNVNWQALHYAALEGLTTLILKLIEFGASVNCYDKAGQTPLHKAVRRGHIEAAIALLAIDAKIETVDWMGNSAFELAVIERNSKMVETLMMFGALPNLQDWTWTMNDHLTKPEKDILGQISHQMSMVPGFKHGAIRFKAAAVQPKSSQTLTGMQVVVEATDTTVPFFIYCCKMQSEYLDLTDLLKENQKIFSDVYECQTWQLNRKTITLKLVIPGVPHINEIASLISPSKNIGKVQKIERNEDEHETSITATINLELKESTIFAIALEQKKETFQITKGPVVIQPVMEPEAEIDIPKDTFKGSAELSLNVMETKDANEDDSNDTGPLLLTNVIDLSMSDGQQPNKPINMKLPVHSKSANQDQMCILATSKEYPDSIDCWEVLDAERDKNGKSATFKVEHFSIYAGASRKSMLKDKVAIIQALHRSLRRERIVEILVYTRLLEERGKFELLVACVTKQKAPRKKAKWEKTYTPQIKTEELQTIEENQTFQLNIDGNMKEVSEKQNLRLDFVGKKGSKHIVLHMAVCDTEKPVEGKLSIDIEEKVTVEVPVVAQKGVFCGGQKNQIHPTQPTVYSKFNFLLTVPIGFELPVEKIEEDPVSNPLSEFDVASMRDESYEEILQQAVEVDLKFPSMIPELRAERLIQMALTISKVDAIHLGYQLLPARDIVTLTEKGEKNIATRVLLQYRGKRPHHYQVEKIKNALLIINRKDLVAGFFEEVSDSDYFDDEMTHE